MIELLSLIFTDYTIRTVTIGAAVLGLVSGVLSCYTVLRKQSLLGDAMSHATLPGVVIAFIVIGSKDTLPLMVGALTAGWLGALLVMLITRQTRVHQDAALGIILAVFFGFGLALLSWVQNSGSGNQSGLDKFLFGRAAALVESDVLLMVVIGTAALFAVYAFWKEFKLLSFDPDYAVTLGLPVTRLDILLTTLIVIAVVVGLQTVGVVLVSAMLVAPAAAARQWTDRLGLMVGLAAVFGAFSGVTGALLSSFSVANASLPTGPTIVLTASVIVLISLAFAPNRGLVWQSIKQAQNRRRMQTSLTLEALYRMALHHGDPLHPHPIRSIEAVVPGGALQGTLQKLAADGLTRQIASTEWALTPAGVAQVELLLQNAGVDAEALS